MRIEQHNKIGRSWATEAYGLVGDGAPMRIQMRHQTTPAVCTGDRPRIWTRRDDIFSWLADIFSKLFAEAAPGRRLDDLTRPGTTGSDQAPLGLRRFEAAICVDVALAKLNEMVKSGRLRGLKWLDGTTGSPTRRAWEPHRPRRHRHYLWHRNFSSCRRGGSERVRAQHNTSPCWSLPQ